MTHTSDIIPSLESILSRMVLATLGDDIDAIRSTGDELGGCFECWQLLAGIAVVQLAAQLEQGLGHDKAVQHMELVIAKYLDELQARRR